MKPQTSRARAIRSKSTCAYCHAPYTPRRRDQKCCSAICRAAHERLKRQIAKQGAPVVYRCTWCDGTFETKRTDREFCSTTCQQAFNNFWKGWGPRFGKALIAWRVRKRPGAFTRLCRLVSEARQDATDKRKEK